MVTVAGDIGFPHTHTHTHTHTEYENITLPHTRAVITKPHFTGSPNVFRMTTLVKLCILFVPKGIENSHLEILTHY